MSDRDRAWELRHKKYFKKGTDYRVNLELNNNVGKRVFPASSRSPKKKYS